MGAGPERVAPMLLAQALHGDPITAGRFCVLGAILDCGLCWLPVRPRAGKYQLVHVLCKHRAGKKRKSSATRARSVCTAGTPCTQPIYRLAFVRAVCMLGSEHIVSGSITGRVRFRTRLALARMPAREKGVAKRDRATWADGHLSARHITRELSKGISTAASANARASSIVVHSQIPARPRTAHDAHPVSPLGLAP